MSTIKVRFFKMDKDGLIQIAINQRVTVERAVPHRYREVGYIEIPYKPRPSPTVIATCDGKPRDALEVALESMTAFTVVQFRDWVTKSLRAQKLDDIVNAIDKALEKKYKRASVIMFGNN